MGYLWTLTAGFLAEHWMSIVTGALCYLAGLRNPLYCARCRQHFRLEREISERLRGDRGGKGGT